ncbi:hypothetical protein ES703_33049 [subsurface metagenome]
MKQPAFKAREIGSLLKPESCTGRVVSVYAGAVNILLPQGLLLSIVERCRQMSALAIRVPCSRDWAKLLRPGLSVYSREEVLRIGPVTIEMAGAEAWSGILTLPPAGGIDAGKTGLFRQALCREGKGGGLLGLYRAFPLGKENIYADLAERELTQVASVGCRPARLCGLSPLIGLGIGFTPSGDDFIAGVLLAERILSFSRPNTLIINSEEIGQALGRTNAGGRTLLWQCLRGRFPAYLLDLALGFWRASSSAGIGTAVTAAAGHGETSGSDACAGLLWLLESYLSMRLT